MCVCVHANRRHLEQDDREWIHAAHLWRSKQSVFDTHGRRRTWLRVKFIMVTATRDTITIPKPPAKPSRSAPRYAPLEGALSWARTARMRPPQRQDRHKPRVQATMVMCAAQRTDLRFFSSPLVELLLCGCVVRIASMPGDEKGTRAEEELLEERREPG